MSISRDDLKFNSQTLHDWHEAARHELDGADPLEKLSVAKDEIKVLPYYDASSTSPREAITAIPPSVNPFLGARSWVNAPKVSVKDSKTANEQILHHLNNGADGVLIEIDHDKADASLVFDRVELPYCSVSFLATTGAHDFLLQYQRFAEKKFDKENITGSLFSHDLHPHAKLFSHWPNFRALGIAADRAETSTTNQLAKALQQAIVLAEQNELETDFIHRVAFFLPIGTDFFLEAAKIKAMKQLWTGVGAAYSLSITHPVFVHAYSPCWINPNFEPHGNLLKQTTAGLSAVVGGCDALTTEPDQSNIALTNRLARNVSSILREESHLARVADPTAGSYYMDELTRQLITETWKKFQTLMA